MIHEEAGVCFLKKTNRGSVELYKKQAWEKVGHNTKLKSLLRGMIK
jgi:hypothetical protein